MVSADRLTTSLEKPSDWLDSRLESIPTDSSVSTILRISAPLPESNWVRLMITLSKIVPSMDSTISGAVATPLSLLKLSRSIPQTKRFR